MGSRDHQPVGGSHQRGYDDDIHPPEELRGHYPATRPPRERGPSPWEQPQAPRMEPLTWLAVPLPAPQRER